MSSTMIQAVIWLAAGGAMLLFLRKRRGRRAAR
jgi:hypothetical protein